MSRLKNKRYGLSVRDLDNAGACNTSKDEFAQVFGLNATVSSYLSGVAEGPDVDKRVVFNKRNWNKAMKSWIAGPNEYSYMNPMSAFNKLARNDDVDARYGQYLALENEYYDSNENPTTRRKFSDAVYNLLAEVYE